MTTVALSRGRVKRSSMPGSRDSDLHNYRSFTSSTSTLAVSPTSQLPVSLFLNPTMSDPQDLSSNSNPKTVTKLRRGTACLQCKRSKVVSTRSTSPPSNFNFTSSTWSWLFSKCGDFADESRMTLSVSPLYRNAMPSGPCAPPASD